MQVVLKVDPPATTSYRVLIHIIWTEASGSPKEGDISPAAQIIKILYTPLL